MAFLRRRRIELASHGGYSTAWIQGRDEGLRIVSGYGGKSGIRGMRMRKKNGDGRSNESKNHHGNKRR